MKDTIAAIATASGKAGSPSYGSVGKRRSGCLRIVFAPHPGRPFAGQAALRPRDGCRRRLGRGHGDACRRPIPIPGRRGGDPMPRGSINGERVLKRVLEAGARPALPGEFTRRARERPHRPEPGRGGRAALIGADSQAAARAAQRRWQAG